MVTPIWATILVLALVFGAGGVLIAPASVLAQTQTQTTWQQLSLSNPMGYEGGIRNEQNYQEVVMVTGQPVVVSGELKFSGGGKSKGGVSTQSYSYKLENKDQGMKLTRSLSLETVEEEQNGQTIQVTSLKSFNETITVGTGSARATYKLAKDGYQFHQSAVVDHCPSVDYFSGNWNGRKIYEINGDEGTVTVDITGDMVGYNQYWGSTETRSIDCYLHYDRQPPTADGVTPARVTWDGTAKLQVSFNRNKDLNYIQNEPVSISFRGGYLQSEQEENILQYQYNLPYFNTDGTILDNWRNEATENLKLVTVPKQERLPVFTMKDTRGHWAEEQITRLISVGAFSSTMSNFGPSLPMTRAGFARAIAELTGMQTTSEPVKTGRSNKMNTSVTSPFADVSTTHPDFPYILAAQRCGLMAGVGQGLYAPEDPLTRAQAVTIIVKALGFQGLAPNSVYRTLYADDTDIPAWARDSVYVVTELGLASGSGSYFYPQDSLTRAEAAVLLDRLREYLQTDLKYDYRDKIINVS